MTVSLRKPLLLSVMLIFLQILAFQLSPQHTNLDNASSIMYSDDTNNSSNFTSSGGSGLAISGEPANVGDSLVASLMVTNNGNSTGSASLRILHLSSDNVFQGESVSISPGSTREVPTLFTMEFPGTNEFSWDLLINGQSGLTELEGNFSVEVSPSQILNLTIDSVTWTASEGLEIDASVFLSQGRERPIVLTASSEVDGNSEVLQKILLDADPGRRTLSFSFGNPDASHITIEAIPVGWSPSAISDNKTTNSTTAPVIDPSSIIIEATFNPERPLQGSRVLATITLRNDDVHQAQSGSLRLITSSERTILAEATIPAVMPGSVVTTEMSVPEWPERDIADIEVQWSSGGISASRIYSVEPYLGDEGMELPFDVLAAGYGVLAGILAILIGTFSWRAVSSRTPSTSDLGFREAKESQSSQLRMEKREIECTYCDQRLMVPNDHTGGVRCPSCSMEFMIGGSHEGDEEDDIHQVVKSSEDILNCPECDQALRVQLDKRPVMSRCPVCKTQFMAEREDE